MYDYYDSGLSSMEILSGLMDTLSKFFNAIAIIMAIYGIIQCLFGYKILKVVLAISGFLTGSMIGAILGIIACTSSNSEVSDIVGGIIFFMLLCGVGGAVISYKVYKLGVFLVGFSGVYLISVLISLVSAIMSGSDSIASIFIFSAIPAGIAGWLVVKFTKPIIIIYTSISGAYLASTMLASIFGGGFLIFVALCVAGIYYQIKSNDGLTEAPKTYHTQNSNQQPPALHYDYTKEEANNGPSAFHYAYSATQANNTPDKADHERSSQTDKNGNSDLPNIMD